MPRLAPELAGITFHALITTSPPGCARGGKYTPSHNRGNALPENAQRVPLSPTGDESADRTGNEAVAEVKSVIDPESVSDDVGREPVAFVDVHRPIVGYGQITCH